MSVNLKELQERYKKILEEINISENIDSPSPVVLTVNKTKIRDGILGISFKIPSFDKTDNADRMDNSAPVDHNKGTINVTLYIANRGKMASVMFVNDKTHEIIFNNASPDAVEKCEKYVCNYIKKNINRLYGLSTNSMSFDKKEEEK